MKFHPSAGRDNIGVYTEWRLLSLPTAAASNLVRFPPTTTERMQIPGTIQLWAFDLLAFNGRDLRPQPLAIRQAVLSEER